MVPVTRNELDEIRQRLDRIEQTLGLNAAAAALPITALGPAPGGDLVAGDHAPPAAAAAGLLTLTGQAMVALGGAFLLRALTESGAVPKWLGVGLALGYVVAWLVLARRTSPTPAAARAFVHGLTAVAIFGPLLWESTLRLRVLAPSDAAVLLVAFTVLGLGLNWKDDLPVFASTTAPGAAVTAVVLLVGAGEAILFGLALVVLAGLVEAASLTGPAPGTLRGARVLVALALDFGLMVILSLVSRPGGLPDGYAPIPAPLLMLLLGTVLVLYLGCSTLRTTLREWRASPFEMTQLIAVLALFLGGAWVTDSSGWMMASFCLLAGAAGYSVAFTTVDRHMGHGRNFYVYGILAFALVAAGVGLLLPTGLLGAAGAALAVTATWMGRRSGQPTLFAHGLLFLMAGAAISGLLREASVGLLGPIVGAAGAPTAGDWLAVLGGAVCAGLLVGRGTIPAVGTEILAFWVSGGLVALLAARLIPDLAWAATLRTGLLSAGAVALGWSRRRWQIAELQWVAGLVVVVAGLKLLFDDFAAGRPLTLCVSLLFFGGTLMLVPRLTAGKPS